MAVSKVSDLNSLFNNIFEDARFVAREMNIMTNLVRNYSATGFMDRKISDYPEVTAVTKAEGDDFASPTTFDKTVAATLTPATIFSQAILTDERLSTDPQDAAGDATTELGNSLATKIDTDLVGKFSSFTTDKGPGASSPATIATFAAAVSRLRNQKAPNPVYVVAHPFHWHDVWTELGQPAANQALLGDVANQALRDFYVGTWINVQWFISANISVDASDDAISGIFNPGAIGFDSRKSPSLEVERDASRLAWELNVSAAYATGIIRQAFGVKYTADAAEPS